MRKKTFLTIILTVILTALSCPSIISAQEKCPFENYDVVFQVNPSNIYQSKLIQSLIQTELFQKGFTKLTEKIDEEYEKNESNADFPKKQADYVLEQIAKNLNKESVSSKDIICGFYEHVNAVILLGNFNLYENEELNSESDNNQNPKLDGQLVFIVDFNPRNIFDLEKMFVKDKDFAVIQDNDGIYAIKNLNTQNEKEFFFGGAEIQNSGRFALVLGDNEDQVLNTTRDFQKFEGMNNLFSQYPKTLKKLMIRPNFFEKVLKLKDNFSGDEASVKKHKEDAAFIREIIEKINAVNHSIVENEEGEMIVSLQLTAKTEEDAESFENLVCGGISLLKWKLESQEELKNEEKIVLGAIELLQFNRNEKTLSAELKVNEDILNAAFEILKPELEQLKNILDAI